MNGSRHSAMLRLKNWCRFIRRINGKWRNGARLRGRINKEVSYEEKMAAQADGNVGTDEAKAEQADGNKGDGSFWYRSPEGLASLSFGSDGR